MANTRLTTRLVLRNDSSENWALQKDQVLLKGEVGIEFVYENENSLYPTRIKAKIGDGKRTWEQLPYFGGDECNVTEILVERGTDHVQAIESKLAESGKIVNKGDIVIVHETISGDKQFYTAYVYGDTASGTAAWKAMDGNYSAENVYFPEDIQVTTPVGYITIDSSGKGVLPAEGKNLKQLFESVYSKELEPQVIEPTLKFNSVTSGRKEVGEYVTPSWSITFTSGSYSYGPDTGIVPSISVVDTVDNQSSALEGSFGQIQITDNTAYSITATATYDSGAVPVTNYGNEVPLKQISGGTKEIVSANVYGERKAFYGAFVTPVDITNGTQIRNNCIARWNDDSVDTNAYCSGKGYTLTIPKDTTQVVVCLYGKRLKAVHDVKAFGTDIKSVFTLQQENTAITGANTYTAVEYNTYVYTPATKLSENTYHIVIE